MAGLPWFEMDVDFHDSPKIEALASRLREPLADAYVARVYAYCYRHARDRFDPEVAQGTIESAARWKGRRGNLFDALMSVGVLEREAGRIVVHGVAERLGPHLAKREADAERQRRRRDKVAESVGRHASVTRDVTPDVTRESRSNKDKNKNKDPIGSVGEGDSCSADGGEMPPPPTPIRRGGLPVKAELRDSMFPLTAGLIASLALLGVRVGHPDKDDDSAAVEANCARDGVEVIARRVQAAYRERPKSTLGWFLDDMAPPKAKVRPVDDRAPVAPSTDWSDKRAPWEIPS